MNVVGLQGFAVLVTVNPSICVYKWFLCHQSETITNNPTLGINPISLNRFTFIIVKCAVQWSLPNSLCPFLLLIRCLYNIQFISKYCKKRKWKTIPSYQRHQENFISKIEFKICKSINLYLIWKSSSINLLKAPSNNFLSI